jgi:predicted ATPase
LLSNEEAVASITQVLASAKNTEDRVKAHEIQILANIAQANFQDAIRSSSAILNEMGVSISDLDPVVIQSEVVKTRALLESNDAMDQKLIQSILSKPKSTNSQQIALMRILCFSSRAAYAINPPLMLYIILKMVQNVVLDEEITAESSYAFGALSVAFSGLGFHNTAHLASKIALALLEQFDRKYYNIVDCLVVMGSMPYRQPAQACIELLRQSYEGCCSFGDPDWRRMSMNQISQHVIMTPERGKTLDDAEREVRQMLVEEPPASLLSLTHVFLQMLLNLKESNSTCSSHDAKDPTVLTGEAMNQERYLQTCQEKGLRDYFRYFFSARLFLAYMFRRYDVAEEMAESCGEIAQQVKFCSASEWIIETFYMGLAAAAILQRQAVPNTTDVGRWQGMATESLDSLTKWADEGSEWNFRHKADLLKAEIAVGTGDIDTAVSSFQSAIMGARNSCYINEEALSCERAGIFHVSRGDMEEGSAYLLRAKTLYSEWGAHRKAQDISLLMEELCS